MAAGGGGVEFFASLGAELLDPILRNSKRRELVAQAYTDALDIKRPKVANPRNRVLSDRLEHHWSTETDCFFAADKLHRYYLAVSEQRKKDGKSVH